MNFIIKKKRTRYREVVNENKFQIKLKVKLCNKFLNVLADIEVGFRTNKWYFDGRYLFSDCRHARCHSNTCSFIQT